MHTFDFQYVPRISPIASALAHLSLKSSKIPKDLIHSVRLSISDSPHNIEADGSLNNLLDIRIHVVHGAANLWRGHSLDYALIFVGESENLINQFSEIGARAFVQSLRKSSFIGCSGIPHTALRGDNFVNRCRNGT